MFWICLKICCPQGRTGSSPVGGTSLNNSKLCKLKARFWRAFFVFKYAEFTPFCLYLRSKIVTQ